MWNQTRSVLFSLFLSYLFSALLLISLFMAPMFVKWYLDYGNRPDNLFAIILVAFYLCFVPAATALFALLRLLKNIINEKVFIKSNISYIRILSWCCFAVSVITFAAGYFYFPFLFITVAALFIALILRVIKNIFVAAAELKTENELTI